MSGVIEEDVDMGNPPGSGEGNGVYVDKAVLEKLLLALSSKSSQSIRVREPDVFRGDRSAIAVASWLGSLECYFELVPLKEKEKVSFAVTLLRDDALIWWNQLKASRVPPSDWSAFKFAFENEFRPVNSTQAARDKLAILSQHSTVARYISEFRSLQLQIPDTLRALLC
ncbi:hypothetical protein G6F24_013422 [Rhizopus arrhizus]|nr:hypothetical protein G6F24_013422 [Rhizopus arrhizus]